MKLIVSETVPSTSYIAADADNLMLSLEAPMIDLSEQATIVLNDDPETDTGVKTASMMQTYSTALRLMVPATWQLIRYGAVAEVNGVSL